MGAGVEVLAELWEGLFLKVIGDDMEQRVADQRYVGQQVRIPGAGTIFSHQRVAAPVIADFNPTPVSANQIQPFLGEVVFGRRAR